MTATERGLLHRMLGSEIIAFREKDRGWLYVDCGKEFGNDRIVKLNDAGIGYVEGSNATPIIYLMDDYSCEYEDIKYGNIKFTALKDTVYSAPLTILGRGLAVKASTIDLSEFCGVIPFSQYCADKIIVGDDCRLSTYVSSMHYIDRLFMEKDYKAWCLHSDVKYVKVIGDTPVASMRNFCNDNRGLKELDLSEANLKGCVDFSFFCERTSSLSSVKMGDINMDADCSFAFSGSAFTNGAFCVTAKDMKEFVNNKNMKSKVFGG